MRADEDGRPKLSDTASWGLGVREPWDIEMDAEGVVHPGDKGTSVVLDPMYLPRHRRPPSFDGTSRDPCWEIQSAELPEGLAYEPDPGDAPRHGVICPAYSMELEDFRTAIQETRDIWAMRD